MVSFFAWDLPPDGGIDWERVDALTDEEIAAAVRDDPDAAPVADDKWFATAKIVLPPPKKAISIRIDEDVLAWFKSLGPGYQTRMNAILRGYMQKWRAREREGG